MESVSQLAHTRSLHKRVNIRKPPAHNILPPLRIVTYRSGVVRQRQAPPSPRNCRPPRTRSLAGAPAVVASVHSSRRSPPAPPPFHVPRPRARSYGDSDSPVLRRVGLARPTPRATRATPRRCHAPRATGGAEPRGAAAPTPPLSPAIAIRPAHHLPTHGRCVVQVKRARAIRVAW